MICLGNRGNVEVEHGLFPLKIKDVEVWIRNLEVWGTWLAQRVGHETLDLGALNSTPV